jgi:hypothetical protein
MKKYFRILWEVKKLILIFSILNALILYSVSTDILFINAIFYGFISVLTLITLIYILDKYDLLEKIIEYLL